MSTMQVSDFDYHLPEHLIAQFPPEVRGGSRLLHVDGARLEDARVAELPRFLQVGDLLVFNDTKVIKARLFGQKESGGQIEALVERVLDRHFTLAHVRASKAPKPGTKLIFAGKWQAEMVERRGDLFLLRFAGEESVLDILDAALTLGTGAAYTREQLEEDVRQRASTVFHPVSTCRMGPSADVAVVDAQLRVHGLQGLRVIDASAFPSLTSGNTNAPTLMLAEKGAAMVLRDHESALA